MYLSFKGQLLLEPGLNSGTYSSLKNHHAILMTINVYSQMLDSCIEHRWSGCHYTDLQWIRRSKLGLRRRVHPNPWKQMLGRTKRQQRRRHKTSDVDMYSQRPQPTVFVLSKLKLFTHSTRFLKSRRRITVCIGGIINALILLMGINKMALP